MGSVHQEMVVSGLRTLAVLTGVGGVWWFHCVCWITGCGASAYSLSEHLVLRRLAASRSCFHRVVCLPAVGPPSSLCILKSSPVSAVCLQVFPAASACLSSS